MSAVLGNSVCSLGTCTQVINDTTPSAQSGPFCVVCAVPSTVNVSKDLSAVKAHCLRQMSCPMPSASKVEKQVPGAPPTNSPSSPAVASQKPIEHPWVSAQPLEEGCAQGCFPFNAQRGQWRVWLWLLLAFVPVLPWVSNPSHTHTSRPKHSKTNSVTQRPNTLDPGHIYTHPCLQMCASTNSGLETGMCKDTDAHRDRMPRITADMPQTFRGIDSAAVTN